MGVERDVRLRRAGRPPRGRAHAARSVARRRGGGRLPRAPAARRDDALQARLPRGEGAAGGRPRRAALQLPRRRAAARASTTTASASRRTRAPRSTRWSVASPACRSCSAASRSARRWRCASRRATRACAPCSRSATRCGAGATPPRSRPSTSRGSSCRASTTSSGRRRRSARSSSRSAAARARGRGRRRPLLHRPPRRAARGRCRLGGAPSVDDDRRLVAQPERRADARLGLPARPRASRSRRAAGQRSAPRIHARRPASACEAARPIAAAEPARHDERPREEQGRGVAPEDRALLPRVRGGEERQRDVRAERCRREVERAELEERRHHEPLHEAERDAACARRGRRSRRRRGGRGGRARRDHGAATSLGSTCAP